MANKHNINKCNNNYKDLKSPLTLIVQPSGFILAVNKVYDLVLRLLFFSIAVLTLLVGTFIDAVLSLISKQPEKLSIGQEY